MGQIGGIGAAVANCSQALGNAWQTVKSALAHRVNQIAGKRLIEAELPRQSKVTVDNITKILVGQQGDSRKIEDRFDELYSAQKDHSLDYCKSDLKKMVLANLPMANEQLGKAKASTAWNKMPLNTRLKVISYIEGEGATRLLKAGKKDDVVRFLIGMVPEEVKTSLAKEGKEPIRALRDLFKAVIDEPNIFKEAKAKVGKARFDESTTLSQEMIAERLLNKLVNKNEGFATAEDIKQAIEDDQIVSDEEDLEFIKNHYKLVTGEPNEAFLSALRKAME